MSANGCTDKEKEFIQEWKGKPADEVEKELERLSRMHFADPDAKKWCIQRIAILKQI